jgi:excisionase family DNA binding protein
MLPLPIERPTLSVPEAGIYLGLGRDAAYRAIHTGELPSIRIGRKVLVPTAALWELLGMTPNQTH